jgi:hypothetical protein
MDTFYCYISFEGQKCLWLFASHIACDRCKQAKIGDKGCVLRLKGNIGFSWP